MRLAGHTYAYRELPLEEALDELAGLDLLLVEVWLGHAASGPDGVARALKERGLEAVAVSAGGFYTIDSDAVPRAIELAEALGASMIAACVAPAVLGTVLERIPAGTTLCVENHWDHPLATSRDMRSILAAHPGTAVCLDTGHAILAGEPPERFVAALNDGVKHVHLKDAARPPLRERLIGRRLRKRLLPRPQPVMPGDGALEVSRIRRALEKVHYAGAVTLEHEGVAPSVALELLRRKWASSGELSTVQA